MLLFAVLATGLTLVLPRQWQATHGVLVRPEAAGLGSERLGKFSDLSEMKTLQETLFELARSQNVVRATLSEVGPPEGQKQNQASWPGPQDIVDFRDSMNMSPPGGAEFGNTEVFYLSVRDHSPKRAATLVACLSSALERRTKQVRADQADSMIAELREGVHQAEAALQLKTDQLTQFEASVGVNLNDLRSLENPLGGNSVTNQDLVGIRNEIRQLEAQQSRDSKLLEVLDEAERDPRSFVATPNTLLASQPALERLKQGLIDAQLHTARLSGRLADSHPFVMASRETEQRVRGQLRDELGTATRGVTMELGLSHDRIASLEARLAENQEKLQTLATHRTAYSQLVAGVDAQTQLVEAARSRLAEAQVHHAGAQSSSLLSWIDEVESGIRPIGPGRTTIVAAAGLGGLLLGLAVLFLVHGPAPNTAIDLDSASQNFPRPTTTTLRQHPYGVGVESRSQPRTTVATPPGCPYPINLNELFAAAGFAVGAPPATSGN